MRDFRVIKDSMMSISGLFLAFAAQAAEPAQDPNHVTARSQLMGKPLSVSLDSDPTADARGVQSQTRVEFAGQARSLSLISVEALPPPVTDGATSSPSASPSPAGVPLATTNWYIGGTQIWAGHLAFQNGSLVYAGGVAPTEIPFPLFAYPVGPVLLQVDAGVAFEGNLSAKLTPGLSYPIQDSTQTGTLQARLSAAGFVEGYARFLLVKAGIGGQVNVIDGATGVQAEIFMSQKKPELTGFGKLRLLNGSVFGFVDTAYLFGSWKRILNRKFYQWNGLCYAFGAESCAP